MSDLKKQWTILSEPDQLDVGAHILSLGMFALSDTYTYQIQHNESGAIKRVAASDEESLWEKVADGDFVDD